jgi:hypothetical protein
MSSQVEGGDAFVPYQTDGDRHMGATLDYTIKY